jgi:hypothetical protein
MTDHIQDPSTFTFVPCVNCGADYHISHGPRCRGCNCVPDKVSKKFKATKAEEKPAPSSASTPCPQGSPSLGMKDPAVIRWHLARLGPDRMGEIYKSWDWRHWLNQAETTEDALDDSLD